MKFNFKLSKYKKISSLDCQDIINNLRFYTIDNVFCNKNNQSNVILRSTPFFYILFRNYLTSTFDNKQAYFNDNLVLGKNYGSDFLKSFLLAINVKVKNGNDILSSYNIYDFNDDSICKAFSFAVGLSLNQKLINKLFAKNLFINKTYCIFGQEELSQGALYEILSFAGHQELNNLICIVDFSQIDNSGFISNHTSIDYKELLESLGWKYLLINDGSNIKLINKVFAKAHSIHNQPVFIAVNTIYYHGSSYAGSIEGIGYNLSFEELNLIKNRFNYNKQSNEILEITKNDLQNALNYRVFKRQWYYDNLIKSNDLIKHFFVLEKSPSKENIFYKNCDLIETLIEENSLNIVFLLGNLLKINPKLLKTNRLISCGSRYGVINNIIQGLKEVNLFNPILITDFNWLASFNHVLNSSFITNPFMTFVINDKYKNYSYDGIWNTLYYSTISNFFVYDIFGLNNYWNSWSKNKFSSICFLNETSLRVNTWEHKILLKEDDLDLNILAQGLIIDDLNNIDYFLKKLNIKFNLYLIEDDKLLNKKNNFNKNVPLLLININENHWFNQNLLDIKNKKYLVEFNEDSFQKICKEILSL
ncbi:thiamine pyrophosphate-dependent enzyme [Mycoplasmoides alvi]|uniref:hypothetical protein n=1 Tax=Mycoplasmoides alvi TaxID=78580 RepID=UPI00051BC408|nr:hypothetical protein [Mycoplasmoides alvi]